MSQPSTAAKWSPSEILAAIFGFPAAIAAVIKIQKELRKWYRRRTQRRTASDIEVGTLGAVQIESLSDSTPAAIDSLQCSKEHGSSGLRLRHHPASVSESVPPSVSESVPPSVMMVHEHRARFQESCGSIGTSVEDVATWTWLKIQTDEADAQTAREQTEWEEVRQSRGGPTAASSSWPDLSEE